MHKTSSRLLALLSLLQVHRDWSGEDLAGRLDITSRTVRRDIDRLRELGYPITTVKGPAGGYRLEAGTHLPPLLFDDDQAVALAVALRTAAAGTTVAEDASRALATLRQVMPHRLRHRVDLLRITAVQPPAAGDTRQVGAQVLMDLSRVIDAREELRFDYAPSSGTSADDPRRVQPHHLVTWRQRWYLVAWDLHRDDWRTFRVERIRPRTPTGPRFAPRQLPGGNVSTFITSRFRGNGGTTIDWPCQGEVVLGLPAADVAPFAEDGVVEELGPRHCRLVLGSWSWTGLAAAIGRFDTDIEVIGPPQLAAAFRDLAARYTHAARATSPETGPAS
ncbi:WYL domain-containing protein [Streptomyces sp. IB2014 016-6]|uniref:helix-turn-helix transcriptional regulator n=1 Tax=Streptomyces sp. IB2014 016-6 TaxID=2517818 RepID=UPI0011C998A4|nr:WYL domain-containing protein [Streptomyces sp. IB2014 016-6]TXL89652.1 WYL domain-containing transcriptional regulator [Streptomyces sp. IB2014 016-6]